MSSVKTEWNEMCQPDCLFSKGACVLRALLAETVRTPTSPAHLHHAWMVAPATKSPKPVTHAIAFQVGWLEFYEWVRVKNGVVEQTPTQMWNWFAYSD